MKRTSRTEVKTIECADPNDLFGPQRIMRTIESGNIMTDATKKIESVETEPVLDDMMANVHSKLHKVIEAIDDIEIPCPSLPGVDWATAGDCIRLVNALVAAVNNYNGHGE